MLWFIVLTWLSIRAAAESTDIVVSVEDISTQLATNQLAIIEILSRDQSTIQDDRRVQQLLDCHEDMGHLKRDLDLVLRQRDDKDEEVSKLIQTNEEQRNLIQWFQEQFEPKEDPNSEGVSNDCIDVMNATLQKLEAKDLVLSETLAALETKLESQQEENDMEVTRLTQSLEEQRTQTLWITGKYEEMADPASSESNQCSEMCDDLQEVKVTLLKMQATQIQKESTLNQTLVSLEEQLGRHQLLHEDCRYGGVVYRSGETAQDQCYPLKCLNGKMKPLVNYTTGNPCVPPFESYRSGCYFYNRTRLSWCNARLQCIAMGGDLAVGPNFATVASYITLKNNMLYGPWVGVRNNMWLNGEEPQLEEWARGEPTMNDECGYIYSRKLKDNRCNNADNFACQLF